MLGKHVVISTPGTLVRTIQSTPLKRIRGCMAKIYSFKGKYSFKELARITVILI